MSLRPYSHTVCPPWQGNPPKHLSAGTQPQPWLAEVTRNASSTWLLGLGLWVGFFLLAYGSDEHPSLHHCLWREKSPKTCPPGFSSVLHSWLNDENHALQWKVAAEKRLSRKSFSDTDSQILGNILLQIPTESNLWAGYSSPPAPSSVSHQMVAHKEQFQKKTKLVYPTKKHSKTQIYKTKQKTDCCSPLPFPPMVCFALQC